MQLLVLLFCFFLHVFVTFATEFTFELPDKEQLCFYEEIEKGVKFEIDYQVVSGGNYDVDCFLNDPLSSVLYSQNRKQYDSFSHTATMSGVYAICFSNQFSSFSHKYVYLDFRNGDEKPLLPSMTRATALTQLESTCVSIHEILKVVTESQTWFRLREAHDRTRADLLNSRVALWSLGETLLVIVISVGQVVLLKSFFNDKRTSLS